MDVDYKELMATKTAIVRETAVLEELVQSREISRHDFLIESDQYYGIGCDLRDLQLLDRAVRSLGGLDEALVLCVAEVSVTYMDPNAADALLSWAKTLSSGESGLDPNHERLLMTSRCHLCPARAIPTRWSRSPIRKDNARAL